MGSGLRRRTLALALLASLVLHAGLLLWLLRQPARGPSVPPGPASSGVELVVVEVEPPPTPAPPSAVQRAPERSVVRAPPAPRAAAPAGREGTEVGTAGEGTASGETSGEGAAPAAEAPRALSVLPRALPTVPGLSEGGAPVASPGQRLRPGEGPSREQQRAGEQARVSERVQTWTQDRLAELRVEEGRMDPYFGALREALREGVRSPPKDLRAPPAVARVLSDYQAQLERYGRGQSPVEDVPLGERRDVAAPTYLQVFEREAARDPGGPNRGGAPVYIARASQVEERVQLRAVVELRQAPDGTLLGQRLVESSGDPRFDRYVLEAAPAQVPKVPGPPARGAGVHGEGLRSVWAFEGWVTFRKKVRDFKLPEDLPYLSGALGLGVLGGRFDVTQLKDVEVVDLRDPRWEVRVRLLRVY